MLYLHPSGLRGSDDTPRAGSGSASDAICRQPPTHPVKITFPGRVLLRRIGVQGAQGAWGGPKFPRGSVPLLLVPSLASAQRHAACSDASQTSRHSPQQFPAANVLPILFFFILFWLYHRLLMRRRGVQLVLVFGGESWAAQELPWGLCILGCLLLESEFVSFVFYFRCS